MKLKQLAAYGITAVILAGAALYRHDHMSLAHAVAPAASASTGVAQSRGELPDFRGIAEQYGPAVVNISTEGVMKTGAPQLFRGRPAVEVPVRGAALPMTFADRRPNVISDQEK